MINHQKQAPNYCPLCESATRQLVTDGRGFTLYACLGCGVHFRHFGDFTGQQHDHFVQVEMDLYSRSVQIVRERSYRQLVDAVQALVPDGRWLDVGCSFGWLLDYVRARGFDPQGIEPSPSAAHVAREKGLPIVIGEYPEARPPSPPYQVISFMDVLEHLPDPYVVLESAKAHLAPNGVLVIQLPDRECLMYRVALWMFKLSGGRMAMPLKRLYLDGLDFPHVYYYSPKSLQAMLKRSEFEVVRECRASTGSWDTMTERVAYLERPGTNKAIARLVVIGASVLQTLDNLLGHGGLLVMLARVR